MHNYTCFYIETEVTSMKVGIIGATGYGGIELIRFLHQHPHVEEIQLFTSSDVGTNFSDRYRHLKTIVDKPMEEIDPGSMERLDVVFTSTPSGVTSKLLPSLINGKSKFIDLSGDYRLKDLASFIHWYKKDPAPQQYLDDAVYGLAEWNKEAIENANLIANPGCYPTAVLLSVLPLLKENLIDAKSLIVDAKSGVSGAGNKPSQGTHFSEINEAFSIYKMNEHQHIPEIEQAISMFANVDMNISFNTHLVPMTRGILATSYASIKEGVTEKDLNDCFQSTYENKPFVRVIENSSSFSTNQVRGSNFCDITFKVDPRTNRVTIVSVIDNLVKGAAGQAIQNMNIQMKIEETTGLFVVPFYL